MEHHHETRLLLSIECHTRSSALRRDCFPCATTTSPPRSSLSSPPTLIHLDRVGSHGVYNNCRQCAEEGTLSVLAGRYALAVCIVTLRASDMLLRCCCNYCGVHNPVIIPSPLIQVDDIVNDVMLYAAHSISPKSDSKHLEIRG